MHRFRKIERKPLPGSSGSGGPSNENAATTRGGATASESAAAVPPPSTGKYETVDAGDLQRFTHGHESAATVIPPPPYVTPTSGSGTGERNRGDHDDDAASTTSIDTVEQELIDFQRNEAERCIAARDWEEAEEVIYSLMDNIHLGPKEKEKWALEGFKVVAAQGRWANVLEFLQGDESGEGNYILAKAHFRLGEMEKAKDACSKAMKLQRKNHDTPALVNETTLLMVDILDALGKKVEARFYRGKLPGGGGAAETAPLAKDIEEALKKYKLQWDARKSCMEGGRDDIIDMWEHAMTENLADLADFCMQETRIPRIKRSTDNFTALHCAAQQNRIKYIYSLHERGADLEAQAKDWNQNMTPLLSASKSSNVGASETLLKLGANISAQDSSGWTCMHYAAWNGFVPLLEALMSKRVPLELKTRPYGWTPLLMAARYGTLETLVFLLKNGSNLHAPCSDNSTALHLASRDLTAPQNVAKVELLLQRGLSLTAKSTELLTPLHNAARHGAPEMCKALIKNGAPKDSMTRAGMAPLHLTVWHDKPELAPAVAKALVESGVPLNQKTFEGNTVLALARKEKKPLLEKYLVDIGATT